MTIKSGTTWELTGSQCSPVLFATDISRFQVVLISPLWTQSRTYRWQWGPLWQWWTLQLHWLICISFTRCHRQPQLLFTVFMILWASVHSAVCRCFLTSNTFIPLLKSMEIVLLPNHLTWYMGNCEAVFITPKPQCWLTLPGFTDCVGGKNINIIKNIINRSDCRWTLMKSDEHKMQLGSWRNYEREIKPPQIQANVTPF